MTATMPQATRKALSSTIRTLRARLIADLGGALIARYRLALPLHKSELLPKRRTWRRRLERHFAQAARATQAAPGSAPYQAAYDRAQAALVEQAAYTWLNRLVCLRLFEARGLVDPAVITGGWDSPAYQQWREVAPARVFGAAAQGDDTAGYRALLDRVFAELALDLPGLFAPGGLVEGVPLPPQTLRAVVEALNHADLAQAWHDELLLGWVYQYFNDPAREALDAKLNDGGKVEPHEIASKTQLFTERYMVDWLLQNSVGPMWLATCAQNGWTAQVQAPGPVGDDGQPGPSLLDDLEARRVAFRAWRDAQVAALGPEQADEKQRVLSTLMPLNGPLEHAWAYYVPQALPQDAIDRAPASFKDVKLLDPACGSGHFLVVALRLLVLLLEEEARHRGLTADPAWQLPALVQHALERCLHGVDLDGRAVQIAAASLWLEARRLLGGAPLHVQRLNLVACQFELGKLPQDDPSRQALRDALAAQADLPGPLTDQLVEAVAQADHLGSLLKVDQAVLDALRQHEAGTPRGEPTQTSLFGDQPAQQLRLAQRRQSIQAALDGFLAQHTRRDDLGLRLGGEQVAAGVRFVRLVAPGQYHLVVGNPPYQGTKRIDQTGYLHRTYRSSADLYSAFLERSLDLCSQRGAARAAMVTRRDWLFLSDFAPSREMLVGGRRISAVLDCGRGAFSELAGGPGGVAAVCQVLSPTKLEHAHAVLAKSLDRHSGATLLQETISGTICQSETFTVDVGRLGSLPGQPFVYWWTQEFLQRVASATVLGEITSVRQGLATGDNTRFLRLWAEMTPSVVLAARVDQAQPLGAASLRAANWVPYIKGADGAQWFEPLRHILNWRSFGLQLQLPNAEGRTRSRFQNVDYYFQPGVAFVSTGTAFSARVHRYHSVFDVKGQSAFPDDLLSTCALMNSSISRGVLESYNPSVSFQVGDALRLPLLFDSSSLPTGFAAVLSEAFEEQEAAREASPEFRQPGPSPWRHAQEWAQAAVDRPQGAPLPPYDPEYDPEPPTDHVSYALGVAMGRFHPQGQGILDPATADLTHALPRGTLLLDRSRAADDHQDGLGHPACAPLHQKWADFGPQIDTKRGLRDYLALEFFDAVHRTMYENKPIHWPLTSAKKTFVAWITIHRLDAQTLPALVADHLRPRLRELEARADTLRADQKGQDEYATVADQRDELAEFIATMQQCAEQGPPPPAPKVPARAEDATYAPNLDDGVMINSAALWPLLTPQWKKPKVWWKELAAAKGRKDYDWSHLAGRYWPKRVDAKCQDDPSLAVAHGCFWRYHPARAYAWELRLQHEIGPDFRIHEPAGQTLTGQADPGSDAHRAAFLTDHARQALQIIEKEALRRLRKADDKRVATLNLLDAGLWTQHAGALWAIEMKVIEKQSPKAKRGKPRPPGHDFRITAPDEPAARAAYVAAHPQAAADRDNWVNPTRLSETP